MTDLQHWARRNTLKNNNDHEMYIKHVKIMHLLANQLW